MSIVVDNERVVYPYHTCSGRYAEIKSWNGKESIISYGSAESVSRRNRQMWVAKQVEAVKEEGRRNGLGDVN